MDFLRPADTLPGFTSEGAPATSDRSLVREPRDAAGRAARVHAASAAIRLLRQYPVATAALFDAWTVGATAGRWLFATAERPMERVLMDARIGGSFCMTERRGERLVEHRGRYVELEAPRAVAFTLTTLDVGGETHVRVGIERRRGGAALSLTHTGLRAGDSAWMRRRWTGMLHGLALALVDASARTEPSRRRLKGIER